MPSHGSTNNRGYGWIHQRERAKWAPRVKAGLEHCRRCNNPIRPNTPWDLGHIDGTVGTRSPQWSGPEHASCNRRAGQREGMRSRTRKPQALSFFELDPPPPALGA